MKPRFHAISRVRPPNSEEGDAPRRRARRWLHACATVLGVGVSVSAALWTWPGCSSAPPPDGTAEAALQVAGDRLAVIALRASTDPTVTRRSVQVQGSAYFAKYHGLRKAHVLHMLGETDYADFSEFESGQCTIRHQQRSAVFPEDDGIIEVELQEAGTVTVELPSFTLPLRPHPFPELVTYFSGVSYEGVARRPSWPGRVHPPGLGSAEAGSVARIHVSGGFDVGPFDVDVEIPRALNIVEVGGRAVVDGSVAGGIDRDLTVSWEPTGGPSTLLVLEVRRNGYDSTASVRCLVEDTGAFTIPGDQLSQLPQLPGPVTDRLSVNRITVQSFQTRDTEDGVALFVAEDSVLLR